MFKVASQTPKLAEEIEKKIKFTESILDDLKLDEITLNGTTKGNNHEELTIEPYLDDGNWKWYVFKPRFGWLKSNSLLHPEITKDVTFVITFKNQ